MATGNSTLVVNGLLMYVTSYISRDSIQDIQNVVHDTCDDDTVTLAKQLLWEHYSDTANLGKNTVRRSKYRHVEDIVDGIRKIDEHFSDKTQLPVIFVASDMRNLPEDQTPKSSTGNSLERHLEILANQMVTVLMETKRAETFDRQSGNQPRRIHLLYVVIDNQMLSSRSSQVLCTLVP